VRRIDLSGSLMASRRIGSAVHTVVADATRSSRPRLLDVARRLETCGTAEGVVRGKFAKAQVDNERELRAAEPTFPTMVDRGVTTSSAALFATPFGDGQAFTTVVSST